MEEKNENEIENKNRNKNENIEVITGNSKDLNISSVYSHVKMDETENKKDKKKKIVIPKTEK